MTAEPLFEQQQPPAARDTARHMIELLRAHYLAPNRPPAGIFAPEIEAPGGKRRADLIWQGCTAAAGRELVGHEVKVTRQDLLAELADATKSDPWQRYCDRWWLVAPDRSIVHDLELPATWGVLLPPSGRRTRSMTVLVAAPRLHPDDQTLALRRLATWLHWRCATADTEAAQRDREIQRLTDINRGLREQLAAAGARPSLHADREQQVVSEILRRLGDVDYEGRIGDWNGRVTVDDVVAALADLGTLNQRARDVGHAALSTVRDLQRVLGSLDRVQLGELEAAARGLATMKVGEA